MTRRQVVAGVLAFALVAGAGWWLSRPDAVAGFSLPPAGAWDQSQTAGNSELIVDVSGAVAAPGLVELSPGARVADAIDAAGGASADAVLDDLNLARKVADGEQIVVPRAGEEKDAEGGLINLNRADALELEDLPGVGPVLAQRIVADREANGPFATLDDLGRVPGVGAAIIGGLDGIATV
jgi:competence protein ComEA